MTTSSAACESTEVERLRAELDAARAKIANLEVALASNRRIGIAVGIVMCQQRLTDSQAFDLLVGVSQRSHRKIRDLAEEIVHTGAVPG
jgi:AmiR/NasT family two-component response regulator